MSTREPRPWVFEEKQRLQKILQVSIREFAEKCQQDVEWLNNFLAGILTKAVVQKPKASITSATCTDLEPFQPEKSDILIPLSFTNMDISEICPQAGEMTIAVESPERIKFSPNKKSPKDHDDLENEIASSTLALDHVSFVPGKSLNFINETGMVIDPPSIANDTFFASDDELEHEHANMTTFCSDAPTNYTEGTISSYYQATENDDSLYDTTILTESSLLKEKLLTSGSMQIQQSNLSKRLFKSNNKSLVATSTSGLHKETDDKMRRIAKAKEAERRQKAAAQRRDEQRQKREEERARKYNFNREKKQEGNPVNNAKRKRNEVFLGNHIKTTHLKIHSADRKPTTINKALKRPIPIMKKDRETKRLKTIEEDNIDDMCTLDLIPSRLNPQGPQLLRLEAERLRQAAYEKEQEALRQEALQRDLSEQNSKKKSIFAITPQQTHSREGYERQSEADDSPRIGKKSLVDLPEISSDYTDEDGDILPKKNKPQWCQSPIIATALSRQSQIDPERVFGQIESIPMEDIFKNRAQKFRQRTGSENWEGPDELTAEEEQEYKLKMGYL